MKKIAIISEHASPVAVLGGVNNGGQNVYVAHLARQLALSGYHVDIFTRRDHPTLPDILEWENGVRIFYVEAGPPEYVPKEELFQHMDVFADQVIDTFRRSVVPYDLVHANFWMSGWVAIQIKHQLGIPFVITFHALGRVRRIHQGKNDNFPDLRFEIEDRIVQEADRIIAECPQDEQDLQRLYQADPGRIVMIPCGFDPREVWPVCRSEARRYLGLPPDEPIVLQLGRMVPRKGIDTVIRGIARLERDYQLSANLVVVGGETEEVAPSPSPELLRLQALAKKERVEQRVLFAGHKDRSELKYYYSAADVFATTPWYEPFGITPLEAMACGVPVVGSNVGGIKFTVVNNHTGLLVSPNDPAGLAGALAKLLGNPELRNTYGQNGLRRVNAEFTWEKVAQAVAALYEDVLHASAGPLDLSQAGKVDRIFDTALETVRQSKETLAPMLIKAADILSDCLKKGGKVLVCGNGGSAADAQHFAAEFVGRFQVPGRAALPVLALTADPAFLTAWSNDVHFDQVFARQVEAFGKPGDVLIGISTSGRSKNIIQAFRAAQARGMVCIALVGANGGDLVLELIEVNLVVPSAVTARIQEVHLLALHTLCELVETEFSARARPPARVRRSAPALGVPKKSIFDLTYGEDK